MVSRSGTGSGEPGTRSAVATVRSLLGACLRDIGASRVFGSTSAGIGHIDGMIHVAIDEPVLAALLADADGRIGPGPGVAALPGRLLRISAAPGAVADPVVVTDAQELALALAGWPLQGASGVNAAVELELDLDSPVPPDASVLRMDPTGGRAMVLDESLRDAGMVILAGPGVLRAEKAEALRAVAARAACGVVNTWGAKGLFAWDDPRHFGTAGLQERDFELAGVRSAPIVIAVGLDPYESPADRWAGGQVLEIEPAVLDVLCAHWPETARPVPSRPALYTELSAALAPLYASSEVPLTPARAAADLAAARPTGALVAADPGPAGLWVARTFPTTELGSVLVPSRAVRGFAAAAGLVAALDGRASISVVHPPVDEVTEAVVELAERWEAALVLEVWGGEPASPLATPAERIRRLADALADPKCCRLEVPVDFSFTRVLVEVAGPVVAWGGGP